MIASASAPATVRIRAITLGADWRDASPQLEARLAAAAVDLRAAAATLGLDVRTVRLALPPLDLAGDMALGNAASVMAWAQPLAARLDARWLCAPVDVSGAGPHREAFDAARALLMRHRNLFLNFMVARDGRINPAAASGVARFVLDVARLSNNGWDNFRVGASLNCPPMAPYFPFARHEGAPGVSLALESTPLFLSAAERCERRCDPDALREEVLDRLVPLLATLDDAAATVAARHALTWGGIDASLAPFPDGAQSVARLVERLGPDRTGEGGTLFWTAFLTNVLKAAFARSGARMAGFNGVMYSVLEDDDLARSAELRALSIPQLLLNSAVCGCGIDMVPVPGDTTADEIAALILDTAALSTILSKPLGVRVLPVPHASVGDRTAFNYDFLCDTRVLAMPPALLPAGLSGRESFGYLPVPATVMPPLGTSSTAATESVGIGKTSTPTSPRRSRRRSASTPANPALTAPPTR
ncbi:MAG: DUF711 family protein [Gemmatimonadaceae bacterium]|nr:DUF711 family protein [Gemmatimonadaceae bacterium]